MVNEEISNRAVNMEVRVSKLLLSEVIKVFKKINLEAEKQGKKLWMNLFEYVSTGSPEIVELLYMRQLEMGLLMKNFVNIRGNIKMNDVIHILNGG